MKFRVKREGYYYTLQYCNVFLDSWRSIYDLEWFTFWEGHRDELRAIYRKHGFEEQGNDNAEGEMTTISWTEDLEAAKACIDDIYDLYMKVYPPFKEAEDQRIAANNAKRKAMPKNKIVYRKPPKKTLKEWLTWLVS
jgi:hypothetical protein